MGLWGDIIEFASSKLAFFPPRPPTYRIAKGGDGKLRMLGQGILGNRPCLKHCTVLKLDTKERKEGGGGETIVALHVPCPTESSVTILFSHGNAVDLGVMQYHYRYLSNVLGVNVFGYDYSGYGASTGKPTVRNTVADLRACWDCLIDRFGAKPENIILYGQSIGSGPTSEFAAKEAVERIGGVVLHSPLASGMRVLRPNIKHWPAWLDIYPNFKHLPQINCPVCILHGTEDEVIDISHGKLLYDLCKRPANALWAEGYDHQNLDASPLYIPTLEKFLQGIFPDHQLASDPKRLTPGALRPYFDDTGCL